MTSADRRYRDLSASKPEHVPYYDQGGGVWRVHVADDQAHLVIGYDADGNVHIDRGTEQITLRTSEARQLLAALGAATGQADARGRLNAQQVARLMSQTDSTFR